VRREGQTSLTFKSQEFGIRAQRLNPSTREVASSENVRRKVNIASRGFMKGRYQGWTCQTREVASRKKVIALSLAGGHVRKVLTKEEPYPFRDFGYCRIGGGRVGVSTHELVSHELRQAPLELGSVHSAVVTWGERSLRLVFFAHGSFPKDLWIDLKRDSSRESERVDLAQRG
jgi:hypothetical protein